MPSTFETALGKLSALLGDDTPAAPEQPKNAMAVGFRASMLPIGNYEDGSIAFPVWPQTAVDAYNAMSRFHRGEPPRPEDAVLAGLAMTGAGIGGLGARAVSGRALEGVEASRPLTSSPVEAAESSTSAYTGPKYALSAADTSYGKRSRKLQIEVNRIRRNAQRSGPRDAPTPFEYIQDVPEGFDYYNFRDHIAAGKANREKVDLTNLKTGQATVDPWTVRDIAHRGPDPSIVPPHPSNLDLPVVALLKGDGGRSGFYVFSGNHRLAAAALRGDKSAEAYVLRDLFSNPKEAAPAGALAAGGSTDGTEHHSRSQPRGEGGRFVAKDSFDGRLAALDKMMVDLDGDGVPDAVVEAPQQPTNAMVRMAKADYYYAPPHLPGRGMPMPRIYGHGEDFTHDMAIPPDRYLHGEQGKPVTGPRMNPPIRTVGPGFSLFD